RRKAMKTLLTLLLLSTGFTGVVLAQTNQTPTTLTGTLRGGRVAIGGETSGWTLEYRDASGPRTVEVELSPDQISRARSGAVVPATGRFATKQYVERGSVRIFRVSRLEGAGVPEAGVSPAPRLRQLTTADLNDQQRALADEILKVSSVGLGGPYNAMLRSPE